MNKNERFESWADLIEKKTSSKIDAYYQGFWIGILIELIVIIIILNVIFS